MEATRSEVNTVIWSIHINVADVIVVAVVRVGEDVYSDKVIIVDIVVG